MVVWGGVIFPPIINHMEYLAYGVRKVILDMASLGKPYSLGGSSDAAFRCRYCSD